MLDGMSSDSSGGPDLDGDTGVLGVQSIAEGCEFSSYSFSADMDASSAEVLAEAGADMDVVGYGEGDSAYDGNPLQVSRNMRNPLTSCVHVVGHSTAHLVQRIGEFIGELGLVRIPSIRVGGREIEQHFDTLMPLSTWSDLVEDGKLGDGSYDGATGTTSVVRQYYCLPVWESRLLPTDIATWLSFGKPVYDREAKTYLEVTVVTWHYAETDDYETRVVIRAQALLEGIAGADRYFINRDPLAVLNRKLRVLAKQVFSALRAAAPKLQNKEQRRRAAAGHFAEEVAAPVKVVAKPVHGYGAGEVVFPA